MSSLVEPLKSVGFWWNVDPAVLRFDISTFSEILAKHHFISRIVSVGSGLEIAICCLDILARHQRGSCISQPLSEIVPLDCWLGISSVYV